MRILVYILIVVAFVFIPTNEAQAQDANPTANRSYYRTKNIGGAFLHTAGFGAYYRRGWRATGYRDHIFNVELLNMRHPKEYKIYTQGSGSTRGYFFGKVNSLSLIRASYGFQKVLFDKEVKRGVRVSYLGMFGPSIGLLKPIYVEVVYPTEGNSGTQEAIERYDFEKHSNATIIQRAPFYWGLDGTMIRPGGHVKAALNFEYSSDDQIIRALEAGGTFDIFAQEIEMMANTYNNQVFLSLYLSLQFGKKYLH